MKTKKNNKKNKSTKKAPKPVEFNEVRCST